jgi:phage shock protein PspC (stress-responsive transcriptional regulator)
VTCRRCAKELEPESRYCRFCGTAVATGPQRRTLTRLPDYGRIAGVCAGLAAYFNTDVTLVRLIWVVLSIVPGMIIGGAIAYAAAWLLLPVSILPPAPFVTERRLFRSLADRKIGGVCAGLAHYIGLDTTVVRLLWVILSIYPGAIIGGVIFYLVAWFIMPTESHHGFDPEPSTV